MDDDGILVKNSKQAVNGELVFMHLCDIKKKYSNLIGILDGFEKSKYDIESAFEVLRDIKFRSDSDDVKEYIISRLEENGISKFVNYTDGLISPTEYYNLLNCLPTSISVERSFSMVKNYLQRSKFLSENVIKYMSFYYNSKVSKNMEFE